MKRRSFLRRAAGVLLAPLAALGLASTSSNVHIIITFDDGNRLALTKEEWAELGRSNYKWRVERDKLCGGYITDKKGRKWAKWRPGATYLRRV